MAITKLPFGRLGHLSSRALFGGASLSNVSQAEADRTLDVLLDFGVNHLDVAASYGDAELRIAPWLRRHPGHFFLATKTGERTAQAARVELHRSLERMGVDQIDLWQLHNLIDFIDMEKPADREKVFNALKEAFKKDKSKTNVLPMSEMGLIQMTRKRVRKSLSRMLCEPCFYCDGDGYLISKQSI